MLYKGELPGINQIVAELVNRLNSEIIQVVCFCKKTVERLWGFNISLFRFCEFDGFQRIKIDLSTAPATTEPTREKPYGHKFGSSKWKFSLLR